MKKYHKDVLTLSLLISCFMFSAQVSSAQTKSVDKYAVYMHNFFNSRRPITVRTVNENRVSIAREPVILGFGVRSVKRISVSQDSSTREVWISVEWISEITKTPRLQCIEIFDIRRIPKEASLNPATQQIEYHWGLEETGAYIINLATRKRRLVYTWPR